MRPNKKRKILNLRWFFFEGTGLVKIFSNYLFCYGLSANIYIYNMYLYLSWFMESSKLMIIVFVYN